MSWRPTTCHTRHQHWCNPYRFFSLRSSTNILLHHLLMCLVHCLHGKENIVTTPRRRTLDVPVPLFEAQRLQHAQGGRVVYRPPEDAIGNLEPSVSLLVRMVADVLEVLQQSSCRVDAPPRLGGLLPYDCAAGRLDCGFYRASTVCGVDKESSEEGQRESVESQDVVLPSSILSHLHLQQETSLESQSHHLFSTVHIHSRQCHRRCSIHRTRLRPSR